MVNMISKTKSEQLFEKFCRVHNIRYRPIPVSTERMPDYDIFIKRRKVLVEVKQIDPNSKEQEKITEFTKSGKVSIKSRLGKRVRGKIIDAQGKFRKRMKNRYPSILVLYNNVALYKHTEPKDILAGMYGQLCFPGMPNLPIGNMELGPKRTMTEITNTSISALGVLKEDNYGNPLLTVYHNIWAKVPLHPDLLSRSPIKQYSIAPGLDWQVVN